jgi:DNA-binding LacI/PurR family transcriptional regulator
VHQAESGLLDGVLLMEVSLEDRRVEKLKAANIPFALIGRTGCPADDVYADRDFDSALMLAVGELVRLGHKKLVFLSTSDEEVEIKLGAIIRSENAAQAAAAALGAEMTVMHAESSIDSGLEAALRFMKEHANATGVVTVNSEAIIGFSRGIQRAGFSVPGDISLVCISTSNAGAVASDPALTTVTPPSAEIGASAVRALIRKLQSIDDPNSQKLFTGSLVARGSTGLAASLPTSNLR